MFNRTTMLYVTVIFLSFCSLVVIKFYVHNLKESVACLEKAKTKELSQIKVLKAEWAYLNKGDRLKYLAAKYLALNESKTSNIEVFGKKSHDKIHLLVSGEHKEVIAIFQPKTNWHYKSREKIFTNRNKISKSSASLTLQKTEKSR